jgi:putative membrane protein
MNPASDGTGSAILDAVGTGLPMLLLQFLLVLALLVAGIFIYMAVTPFHERDLLRNGNPAAATVLGGALVALAIPLAALLATTAALLDILVWGVVAVLLQLLTVTILLHLLRGMRAMIEAGQVAAAIPLVAAQISIGLLNAAAIATTTAAAR